MHEQKNGVPTSARASRHLLAGSFTLKIDVDDISEQGINLHARVFGSGWKSDMQLRMNSGGHGETLDAHDAMFVFCLK